MLSLDGGPHRRHRDPFSAAFRGAAARDRLESLATQTAYSLVNELKSAGQSRYGGAAELRRGLAGPLAVAVVTGLLGLPDTDPAEVLTWYDAIVTAVTAPVRATGRARCRGTRPQAGRAAFAAAERKWLRLRSARRAAGRCWRPRRRRTGGLTPDEVASDAAVLMFGGIETTEGMISNAVLHLLSHPAALAAGGRTGPCCPPRWPSRCGWSRPRPWSTGTPPRTPNWPGARIRRGDLVRVSIAGANRDPAVFDRPDEFDAWPSRRAAQPGLRPRAALLPGRAARVGGDRGRGQRAARPAARAAPRPRPPGRPARPGVPQAAGAARPLGRSGWPGRLRLRRPGWSAWPGPASSR